MDVCTGTQNELEVIVIALRCALAHRINERDAFRTRLLPAATSQLFRTNGRQSEIAVHAARFPISWVARVDDRDAVEIAGQPDAGAETGGAPAGDCDLRHLFRRPCAAPCHVRADQATG